VTAPAGCPSWSAFTSAGWMTLSLTTGTGRGQVVVNAAANTGAARSGTVTIAGQTFSATQSATQGADACGALDVTSQVGVTQGQFNFFSLEFGTAIFYQNVTVMNTSSGVVPGPVYLALIGLPTHHHSLFGPESFLLVLPPGTAATTCFTPVDDYPIPGDYLIPISGGLQPGQSVPLLLTFGQGGWPLSYSAKVLSGAPSH